MSFCQIKESMSSFGFLQALRTERWSGGALRGGDCEREIGVSYPSMNGGLLRSSDTLFNPGLEIAKGQFATLKGLVEDFVEIAIVFDTL